MIWTPPEIKKKEETPAWTPPELTKGKEEVVQAPEITQPVNPEREIQEKELEKSAYDAGLIPELKPFTPETFIAKQDNIQQFVDNKNVFDADAYFTQKAIEDENNRQEQIVINAQKLGLEPEFLNRVVDINKAAHPVFQDRKQQEDYLLGSLGSFNEGLAEVFRTFDRASTMMADAVGLEWRNPIFKTMSDGLTQVGAEGTYKVPDNVVGNVMGGMAGMAPDLMMTYLMPEMKLTQMGRLTGGALTKIPKFPTWLGTKQGLQAYSQSGDSADRYREFFSGAQHGFTEGLTYEALGLTGAQAGKLAQALGGGKLITESTAGIANGTLFGLHGALMNPEFLQTGEIDPKQFFTDFGMGLAFHGKKIGEELVNLATVNQSMLRKAHTSFWTSNRDMIRTGFVSPKSQYQLRRESQDLWDKAMKAESPAEKNQYLMAKTAVDNIISSRAYAIMVGTNPQRFKDAIKNDPNLGDKEKETMLRRIEETAEDFQTTIEEGNRGTNIAPEFEKFTETGKKKSEEEKKLTKTEEQKPETETTKKIEEAESLPKGKASAKASGEKITEKEVKDAEGNGTGTQEGSQEKGTVGKESERIRVRDNLKMETKEKLKKEESFAKEIEMDRGKSLFKDLERLGLIKIKC